MEEARKKDEKIQQLNKERDYNAKEIRQRDTTIGDKEGKIYELKKQNQELEKFKFVLDYKIRELKAQIDPKNDKIAEMKKEIQAMDADLEDYHKKNTQLQVNIQQLDNKHKTLQDDIVSQRKKMTDCQTVIKRFKTDLHEPALMLVGRDRPQKHEDLTFCFQGSIQGGYQKSCFVGLTFMWSFAVLVWACFR